MKIDLAAARTAPKELRVSLPPESIDTAPDADIIRNVDLIGALWRDSRGPHLSGHFATQVRLECTRCLGSVELTIEADFARSDAIRDQLAAEGVLLEDTAQGVRWKRA